MKVLLVNTYRDYAKYLPESLLRYSQYTATLEDLTDPWPPLEWAYVSAVLKRAGHEVAFVDAHLDRRSFHDRDFAGYDFVVANTAPYEKWRCTQVFYDHALDALRAARAAGAGTAVFGPHVTTTPEYFGEVDAAITGEPDAVMVDVVEGRRKGIVVAPEIPLDDICYPDFSILDFGRYDARVFFHGAARGPLGVAMGSRGCPYPCTFCFKALVPDKVRLHSPDVVLRMVEEQMRRGVRAIIFEDLTFTINKKWTLDVCERLRDTGIRYSVMTRTDRIDDDIARALSTSGCIKVELGVEAGDDEMLKQMRKKAAWENTLRATALLRRNGIANVSAFRMVFVPGETRETIHSFIDKCKSLGFETFPNICTPYPKTPLWQQGVAEGKIRGDRVHWEDAALAAGTIGNGFDRDEIARMCDRMAWESHRPYWRSLLRYARSHGVRRMLNKVARVSSSRLVSALPSSRLNR